MAAQTLWSLEVLPATAVASMHVGPTRQQQGHTRLASGARCVAADAENYVRLSLGSRLRAWWKNSFALLFNVLPLAGCGYATVNCTEINTL